VKYLKTVTKSTNEIVLKEVPSPTPLSVVYVDARLATKWNWPQIGGFCTACTVARKVWKENFKDKSAYFHFVQA
jgi:hypothetical protein